MDFEAYYSATEQAFAEEKAIMLDKIDKLRDVWSNASQLDETLIDKCKEMLNLKRMISRGHLQILRTREECLQMELKIAQLKFHNRQLQSEIFRLLPYSHTEVPSTEYHMSLDRKVYKEAAPIHKIEADPEHAEDIKRIHKKWVEICDQQQTVFAEEKLRADEDNQQWKEFIESLERQNNGTQKLIDTELSEVTKKYIGLKISHEDLQKTGQETIDNLAKKIKRLQTKTDNTLRALNKKKETDLANATKNAARMTKELRRRVAEISSRNQMQLTDLQAENERLLDEHEDFQYDIEVLEARARQNEQGNRVMQEEGKQKIEALEAQLNALISAAAAIKDPTIEEELNIIGAVSSAMNTHGKAAMNAERVNKKVRNLSRRIEAACLNLE